MRRHAIRWVVAASSLFVTSRQSRARPVSAAFRPLFGHRISEGFLGGRSFALGSPSISTAKETLTSVAWGRARRRPWRCCAVSDWSRRMLRPSAACTARFFSCFFVLLRRDAVLGTCVNLVRQRSSGVHGGRALPACIWSLSVCTRCDSPPIFRGRVHVVWHCQQQAAPLHPSALLHCSANH